MDQGEDLDKGHVEDCAKRGKCPRCLGSALDMRGTNASQVTLDARGNCYWEYPSSFGFKCNKTTRDRLAKKWT